jgi:protein-disulfide isomerase
VVSVVERDDVRRELDAVRRRREEAGRLEAKLARQQASLEGRLAELKADPAGRRAATKLRLERMYGPTQCVGDLMTTIHAWRGNIPSVSSLWMEVRPGRDHVRGDPAAPLVVVEYGDYQCPECAEAHAVYERVRPWLEDGRLCVAFRHFPLVDAHRSALRAAQAAEAAGAQGRFWEMHDGLMELVSEQHAQGLVTTFGPRDAAELEHIARRAGVEVARFRDDLDDPAALERILEDFRGGLASGVNGTPTFYVNGRRADAGAAEEIYAQIADSPAIDEPVGAPEDR